MSDTEATEIERLRALVAEAQEQIETYYRASQEWLRVEAQVAKVREMAASVPLIVSGIRRDIAVTPGARGGEIHHNPGTPTFGGSGCPGDNLTRWFDALDAALDPGGDDR